MNNNRRIHFPMLVLAVGWIAVGCQSPVKTQMIDLVDTRDGVRVKSSNVRAQLDTVERSPMVTAVQLYTDLATQRWIGSYCLSPDDNTLVLEIRERVVDARGRRQWSSNLWSTDAASPAGLRRLTDGSYFDRDPAGSPDGRHLYFASNRAGRSSVWRYSMGTQSGLGLVTSVATSDSAPQISPDGKVLLYAARTFPSDHPQIWSLELDGGLPTHLGEGDRPRWSPDGKGILYSAVDHNTGRQKIWTMKPDGSSPIQLTHSTHSNDLHPIYSPDMSMILFASDRGQSSEGYFNYDIWLINADGSKPRQLTTNGSHDDLPLFHPDGKTIIFRSNRGNKWDLWKLQLADPEGPVG